MTFRRLQSEQAAWASYNFGGQPALFALLGIVEEVGELAHANLKALQRIRGSAVEHDVAKRDAVADIVIYLADYCTREGYDLDKTITAVWEQVKTRDWRKYPATGRPEQSLFPELPSPLDALAQALREKAAAEEARDARLPSESLDEIDRILAEANTQEAGE